MALDAFEAIKYGVRDWYPSGMNFFARIVLRGKARNFGPGQTLEIFVSHFNHFSVRAGVEGNLVVLAERIGDIDLHAIKMPEGRHGAGFAIREFLLERFFGGELHLIGAGYFAQV